MAREQMGQGAKGPGSELVTERKGQGTNWPGSCWPIRSWERIGPGAKTQDLHGIMSSSPHGTVTLNDMIRIFFKFNNSTY